MVRAAVAALISVTVGLGAGYLVWGGRASALATSLDRLTLEYDALRARWSVEGGTTSRSVTSLLETLSGRVREQGDVLAQQTQALARLIGDAQHFESPAACDEVETRMHEQLEACLFTRVKLEREVAAAKQAAAPRPPGKQTVTETLELPKVPGINERTLEDPANRGTKAGDRPPLEVSAEPVKGKTTDSEP